MNCSLYYHLQQEAYLANLKGEVREQARKEDEMLRHTQDCPFCNGHIPGNLVTEFFGGGLVVIARACGQEG